MVRKEFMEQIVELLQPVVAGCKWRDLYSNIFTAQFPDHIIKAELADWSLPGWVSWVNPPFSIWAEVAQRIVLAKDGHFACLVPDWGSVWIGSLLQIATKYYIPSGTSLFQLDGTRSRPMVWGCWLLHIKPGLRPLVAELENVTILAWNRVKSVGQKRRERKAKCRPADPVTV